MQRRIRATLAAVGVAVVGLAALAMYFGAFNALFHRDTDFANWSGKARIELMPPSSAEYLERHFPGPDGHDLKTEVEYRNGDRGVKLFRADNTLQEWTIEFAANSGIRLHAVYAKDGKQVVAGEQLRSDRSLLWKATTVNNVVTLTTYYFDGTTPFSIKTRGIGADTQDTEFITEDGKVWLRQVADTTSAFSTKPQMEERYDVDGHLMYRRASSKDGKTTTVTYFRADGTAAYMQTWVEKSTGYGYYGYGYGYGDEEYSPPASTVLQTVDMFGPDGSTVVQRLGENDNGSGIATVTNFAADGSSVTYSIDANNQVTHVEKKDKDGKVTESSDAKPGAVKEPELDDDVTVPLPTPQDPTAHWKELEKDPSKRTPAATTPTP